MLAARTRRIALSTAGIVLPLRHPLHVAKAAASLDVLSGGRFVLGAASGDRPVEFQAFGRVHDMRGAAFREAVSVIRAASETSYPAFDASIGRLAGEADLLPKPTSGRLPILGIGGAQQTLRWTWEHMDGWVTYPRDVAGQARAVDMWRASSETGFKPFAQSLVVDLVDDPDAPMVPVHLGMCVGRKGLIEHLAALREIGGNHVILNPGRSGARDPSDILEEIGADVMPLFRSS